MAQTTVVTTDPQTSPNDGRPAAVTADNGNIWVIQPDRALSQARFHYSLAAAKGSSWTEDTGSRVYPSYPLNAAMCMIGDKVWCITDDVFGPYNNFITFYWGTLNAARTAITWTSAVNLWSDGSGDYAFVGGMTAHAEGTGYKVHVTFQNRFYGDNRYVRLSMDSSGAYTGTDVSTNWSTAGIEGVGGVSHVIHDPATKDLFFSAMVSRGGGTYELWMQKRAYTGATWPAGTTRVLADSTGYSDNHESDFDGDRFVAVLNDDSAATNTPTIVERDKADTTTTVRTPPTGVAGSMSSSTALAIQTNASKDVLITWNDVGGDPSDIYKNTYVRGTGLWSGPSLVRDVTPGTSNPLTMHFAKGTKYFFFMMNSDRTLYMLDDMLEVAYTGAATMQSVFTMTATPTFTLTGGTTIPRPLVEIAFTTDPTNETPIWTDVTEYCSRIAIRRGRQRELDVIEPGQAKFTLDNDDRRFDPMNTASPYYPNILPVRRIRVRAIWNSVIYPVFSGYASGWPQEYPGKKRGTVDLDAVDALGFLSFGDLTLTRGQELSGARVVEVLNQVDWPASDRDIDAGEEILAALVAEETNALDALQEISATELGRLFAAKDGRITFHSRARIVGVSVPGSSGTWSDDPADKLYDDIVPAQDEGEIRNRITVTRTDGSPQVAEDETSKSAYFLRDYSQSDVPILTDGDALARAQFLLSQYKDPHLRFSSMVVNPRVDDQWAAALDLEIGDHLLAKRFVASPPTISQDVFVDGINHDVVRDKKSWVISYSLTPVPDTASYWIAGTSRLNVDSVLGF